MVWGIEEEAQLEWDDSDEHIQLGHTPPTEGNSMLDEILTPKQLFPNTEDGNSIGQLTEESSQDEVFFSDQQEQVRSTKLQRRKAIRRKKKTLNSEPRVTRNMIHSDRYQSISCPTTPSQVQLDKRQNLEEILIPRNPIIPELVEVNDVIVQTMDRALEKVQDEIGNRRRKSRRTTEAKIDYRQLH